MAACADEADKPVLGADMKELAKDIWNRPWSEERRNDVMTGRDGWLWRPTVTFL